MSSSSTEWSLQTPPPLPEGYTKHHIVFLEAVHMPLAPLSFPYTMDKYQRTLPHEIATRIAPATIVISNVIPVLPSDMDHAPHLQLLAILATGMGWVDKEYCAKRGLTVVNGPGANIDAVSEHFLALYFASRRRVGATDLNVKTTDEWTRTSSLTKTIWPSGPPLGCGQETLGIIGYGALGQKIESLCRALGFKEILIAERKGATSIRPGRTALSEVLKLATTIVVVCPRDHTTENLISTPEFLTMNSSTLLINMARGGIINELALAKALQSKQIFGAATDVLETEPGGPGTTPLLPDLARGDEEVPNLIVTSHVAWFSEGTIENLQGINRDAMTAFVEGRMYDPKVRKCVAVHDGKIWK